MPMGVDRLLLWGGRHNTGRDKGQERTGRLVAVVALSRGCEMVSHRELTHECAGSRLSPPENLVSTASRVVRRE